MRRQINKQNIADFVSTNCYALFYTAVALFSAAWWGINWYLVGAWTTKWAVWSAIYLVLFLRWMVYASKPMRQYGYLLDVRDYDLRDKIFTQMVEHGMAGAEVGNSRSSLHFVYLEDAIQMQLSHPTEGARSAMVLEKLRVKKKHS